MSTESSVPALIFAVGSVVTMIFMVLRMLLVVDWTWMLVMSPLWGGLLVVCLLVTTVTVFGLWHEPRLSGSVEERSGDG